MKKSNFTAMILGTISIVLFALGMCMTMLSEWGMFRKGIAFGCAGLVSGLLTVIIWRQMEHKEPIHMTGKNVLAVLIGILGVLLLGIGMCLGMVWNLMLPSVFMGLAGILILLILIPFVKGLK